ncbi:hypothetical protein SAMN04488509_102120 [Aquimonas voraii]|uniref:Uncharacterized protein n=1 Tax=Aquimonas voraii TaxID=265719 RepID=A0A1G6U1N6_9GAMM|nr:hypothetical protein SAMN04488509_102120 [Aquimonas voraii]
MMRVAPRPRRALARSGAGSSRPREAHVAPAPEEMHSIRPTETRGYPFAAAELRALLDAIIHRLKTSPVRTSADNSFRARVVR